MELVLLCAKCRAPLPELTCTTCGFTVTVEHGICDFLSADDSFNHLKEEIDHWDEKVSKNPTRIWPADAITLTDYFSGSLFDPSARRMLPELRQMDLHDKVCLDVGGTGLSGLMVLRSGGRKLFHLEVSRQSLLCARKNTVQFAEHKDAEVVSVRAPAERMPFGDESVDFLISFGTYHHTDRQRSIPEIHRVLKPGGMFFFREAYVGPALLPAKWLSRKTRRHWGFRPGNDNPFGLRDLFLLKKTFPNHNYAIRNPLAPFAHLVRYADRSPANRIDDVDGDLPGLTAVGALLAGVLLFSGKK